MSDNAKVEEWNGHMWTDGSYVYTTTADSINNKVPFRRTLHEFFSMRDRIVSNRKRRTQAYSENFVDAVLRIAAILDGDYLV